MLLNTNKNAVWVSLLKPLHKTNQWHPASSEGVAMIAWNGAFGQSSKISTDTDFVNETVRYKCNLNKPF